MKRKGTVRSLSRFPLKDPYENETFKPFDIAKYQTFTVDELKISYLMVNMVASHDPEYDDKRERADFHECMDFLVQRGMVDRQEVEFDLNPRGWLFKITALGNEMAEEFVAYGNGKNLLLNNLKDQDATGFTISGRNPFVALYIRFFWRSMEKRGLMKTHKDADGFVTTHVTAKGTADAKRIIEEQEKKFTEDFR